MGTFFWRSKRKCLAAGQPPATQQKDAVRLLQVVLEAVVENYEEYKDYNASAAQSDYGENLYALLDFLRLKAAYEHTLDPVSGCFVRAGIFERYDTNPGPGFRRSDLNYFMALGFNF